MMPPPALTGCFDRLETKDAEATRQIDRIDEQIRDLTALRDQTSRYRERVRSAMRAMVPPQFVNGIDDFPPAA